MEGTLRILLPLLCCKHCHSLFERDQTRGSFKGMNDVAVCLEASVCILLYKVSLLQMAC
jgi:hypothetical protein